MKNIEFCGCILLIGQWLNQCHEIVKNLETLIDLLIYSPLPITFTQSESLKLEQGDLKIQIKTIIWKQKNELNIFQMLVESSAVIPWCQIVPVDSAAELQGK